MQYSGQTKFGLTSHSGLVKEKVNVYIMPKGITNCQIWHITSVFYIPQTCSQLTISENCILS